MRTFALLMTAAALLWGCGPMMTTTPDAGRMPDTSCGLDCEAQRHYALLPGTCFEYADSRTPAAGSSPAIGVMIRPVFALEGGINTIRAEYRVGGQLKMIDSFVFPHGDLALARREWPMQGQSVTYKDTAQKIVGLTLHLRTEAKAGESLTTSRQADEAMMNGMHDVAEATVAVVFSESTMLDLTVPQETFTKGLTLSFTETPKSYGLDPKRVLVAEKGFVNFASALSRTATSNTVYYLQRTRSLGVDGGGSDCGL